MARAIWTGVMSFGLVSVPVALYSATEAHEPTFHQFERDTDDRIRYQRVNERTGKEVDYDDVVKGAETSRGKYVMLEQDELDSIAPGRSRSLDIQTFVDIDAIDPIYFAKSYYLGPDGEENKKAYALLRDALAETNRAAIANFVMRSKEYLATVRADGDVLVLETMFFADEVRDPHDEVPNLPRRIKLRPQELRMATQLIESMTGSWRPADYRDTFTDRINELIKAKRSNREVEPAEDAPSGTNVVDLMEALRASVDAAKQGGRSGKASAANKTANKTTKKTASKSAAKKSSATKTAAKKTAKKPAAKKTAAKKTAAKKTAKKSGTRKKAAGKRAA